MPESKLTEGLGFAIRYRERNDLIDASALTPGEREQFDYLDWTAIDEGRDSATFFRRERDGNTYCLDQFVRTDPRGALARLGYHASMADSAFSGIAIHPDPEGDYVISALVLS